MSQIKVGYRTVDGHHSTAYIDSVTGVGSNKHTDEDVILRWSDDSSEWEERA